MFLSNMLSPKGPSKPKPFTIYKTPATVATAQTAIDSSSGRFPVNNGDLGQEDHDDMNESDKSDGSSGEKEWKRAEKAQRQQRMCNQMRMAPLPELDIDDFDHGDTQEPILNEVPNNPTQNS